MDDGEAAALVVEYDHRSGEATIAAYTPLADVSSSSVTLAYLSACDEGIIPEGDLYHLSHTKIPLDSFLFLPDGGKWALGSLSRALRCSDVFGLACGVFACSTAAGGIRGSIL